MALSNHCVLPIWSDDPIPTDTARVVLGVSGSLGNLSAVHAAARAASTQALPLVAVMAWIPVGGESAYLHDPQSPLLAQLESEARERLNRVLHDAFGAVRPNCWPVVARGEPAWTLTRIACRPDDQLVLGAGRDLRRWMLWRGHVARRCLREAVCPVVVVPQPDMLRELSHAHAMTRSIRMRAFD